MFRAMQRSYHRDDTAADDRVTRAEFEALKASVAILMRAAAAEIRRQAEVDARDLLTLKQAAHDAGVASEGTIRFWFSKGLPFETSGIKRYVSRQALAEFMAGRK